MILSDLLKELAKDGCYPSIYRRGKFCWRAHVNAAGNHWHDDTTPLRALRGAVESWKGAGKPADGMAHEAAEAKP
jgi:hypothetical protein